MDPSQLAQTVTNRSGSRAAEKAERDAAQKDAKSLAAADTISKSLPTIATDIAAVKNHLSKLETR